MVYKKLIRLYTGRKQKLQAMLGSNSANLKPERMQQIKGAVDEIDLFLLTLSQYQDKVIKANFERQLVSGPQKTGILSRLGKMLGGINKTPNAASAQAAAVNNLNLGELPIDKVPS